MPVSIFDLTHEFHQFMPEWPSSPGVNLTVSKYHARDGVFEIHWDGIMHRGTHVDAPLHVTENTPDIAEMPLWRFCGPGVVVSAPKGKWGLVTVDDLARASPGIEEGDIVIVNTGFHRMWGDNDDYFSYGAGISPEAAEWLVARKIKLVGFGHQANDHPMATKLVDHGLGPTHPHLIEEYTQEFGHDPKEDFPDWEPAHKTLLVDGGVPGIENVGGELDEAAGRRCFFLAFPWRWEGGDGSVVRILALTDPEQEFRFEIGARE